MAKDQKENLFKQLSTPTKNTKQTIPKHTNHQPHKRRNKMVCTRKIPNRIGTANNTNQATTNTKKKRKGQQ